jgi:hypothetical protein
MDTGLVQLARDRDLAVQRETNARHLLSVSEGAIVDQYPLRERQIRFGIVKAGRLRAHSDKITAGLYMLFRSGGQQCGLAAMDNHRYGT